MLRQCNLINRVSVTCHRVAITEIQSLCVRWGQVPGVLWIPKAPSYNMTWICEDPTLILTCARSHLYTVNVSCQADPTYGIAYCTVPGINKGKSQTWATQRQFSFSLLPTAALVAECTAIEENCTDVRHQITT